MYPFVHIVADDWIISAGGRAHGHIRGEPPPPRRRLGCGCPKMFGLGSKKREKAKQQPAAVLPAAITGSSGHAAAAASILSAKEARELGLHRARALMPRAAYAASEISLRRGEAVWIDPKDRTAPSGYLLVTTALANPPRHGLVPSSGTLAMETALGEMASDFEGEDANELTVRMGDQVALLHSETLVPNGWVLAASDDAIGFVPETYVTILDDSHRPPPSPHAGAKGGPAKHATRLTLKRLHPRPHLPTTTTTTRPHRRRMSRASPVPSLCLPAPPPPPPPRPPGPSSSCSATSMRKTPQSSPSAWAIGCAASHGRKGRRAGRRAGRRSCGSRRLHRAARAGASCLPVSSRRRPRTL